MKNDDKTVIQPRLLRPPQAHAYLSMSRSLFDESVRPYVREIKIGSKSIAFDRLELDRWVEERNQDYAAAETLITKGKGCQRKVVSKASLKGAISGISIGRSQDMAAFAAALEQATGRKQKSI